MTRPAVTATTERLYDRLAEVRRVADADLDYPLLRYLAATGDQLHRVVALLDRFNYVPADEAPGGRTTSDLVDPVLADAAWLPWLAQLVGVRRRGLDTAALREAVAGAVSGFQVGTKTAVANAARSVLTGTRYVAVYDHSTAAPDGIGAGGPFDVLLVTRTGETPDVTAVLAAVAAAGAKPAGVVLHHRAYTATWDAMEATYPTWADRDGKTWGTLEEAGL